MSTQQSPDKPTMSDFYGIMRGSAPRKYRRPGMTGDYQAWADTTAHKMRDYYEANKPLHWWQKRRRYESEVADNLMLGLLNVALDEWNARAASGMEARRAAAENTDAVHDSPTGEAGDAHTLPPPSVETS